jgi:hypothetical protein
MNRPIYYLTRKDFIPIAGFLEYSVRMDQSESEPDYKKAQVMNRLAGLGIYNTCLMGVVTAGLDLLVNKP